MLGSELSLAAHLADVSEESARAGRALARYLAASKRRALSAGGIRHLCAADRDRARGWMSKPPGRRSARPRPMPVSKEFKADLDVLHRSLIANNSRRDRARAAAAVAPRGGLFRLSSRQPRHAAEFRRARAHRRRTDRRGDARHVLSGAERGGADRAAASELRNARPLTSSFVKYSEETLGELAVFHAAAEAHARFGADVIPQCIISMCKGDVRHAGGRAAAEGGRPRRSLRPQRDQHRAAVRDHRGFAGIRRHHGPDAVAARLSQAGGQPRRGAGGDARLFRQQQGWRLRHLGLGALQGRDRPGRGVRAPRRAACGCFMAAAARSAAAAGRATTPSSRNPAAR